MKNQTLLLALWFTLLGKAVSLAQTTVVYTESQEVIANPERGLQKYSITNNTYTTTEGYSNLNTTTLSGWRTGDDKVTVIFRYFLLEAFLSTNISATYLNNMQLDFDRIRAAGLKCIVRFSYSNAQHATNPQQASKAQILQHLEQLAPLLENNRDVILSHQAGFLGTWGEWYYTNSSEFGTDGSINTTQWQNRKEVVDAMLAATPEEIPVQVRYPAVKKTMYGNTPLTAATAYQNTALARIGFFNDAFLNVWGDMGTYSVGSEDQTPIGTADYTYLSNETKYTPMTGETNGLNAPRTDGDNAVNEMNLTHWSTLNRDYYTQNFTNWIASGHYGDILHRLGYRYVLQNSTFHLVGNQLEFSVELENKGFARLFKERKAWLILKHITSGTEYPYVLNTDPRTWEEEVNVQQTLDLSALPEGSYEAYLYLPDSDPDLALRPEYSVRMANDNVWDAASGYNRLLQTVSKTVLNTNESLALDKDLKVYPNPAFSSVCVHTPLRPAQQVLLVNGMGQVVRRLQPEFNFTLIDLTGLQPGFYLVQVIDEAGQKSVGLSVK